MKFPMQPMSLMIIPEFLENWWLQKKYNGWRIIFDNGKWYTRRGTDITDWKIFEKYKEFKLEYPLDMELTSYKGNNYGVSSLRHSYLGEPILIDIMVENMKMEERNERVFKEGLSDVFKVSENFPVSSIRDINMWYSSFIETGCDGVVLKKKGSLYHIGKLQGVITPDWLKVKSLIKEE